MCDCRPFILQLASHLADASEVLANLAEKRMRSTPCPVAIVMGSKSDYSVMAAAELACLEFGIACETRVLSAHRTPSEMAEFGNKAHSMGFRVIIAGAGGAAHLPGMLASFSPLPVIGVPIERSLGGLDSLLSIAQMPSGVPVATMAINGARNAGIYAAQILSLSDAELFEKVVQFKKNQGVEAS